MSGLKSSIRRQKQYTPKSLHEALLPMKICCAGLGLGICEYPLGILWTKASILWALSWIIWAIVSFIYLQPMFKQELEEESPNVVVVATGQIIMFARTIDHLSIPIFAWSRQKKLRKLIDRISQSDSRLFILNIKSCYRNLFFWQIGLQVFTFCHNVIVTIISSTWIMEGDISLAMQICAFLFSILPNCICVIFDNYFVILVHLLGMRFSQLNNLLKSLMPAPEIPQHKKVLEYTNLLKNNEIHSIINDYCVHDDEILMNKIRSVHLELVRLGQSVNAVFGIKILSSMIIVFSLLCTLLYRLWVVVSSPNEPAEKWMQGKFIFVWLTFFVYKLLIINIICGRTSNMAKETGDIICELHVPSANLKFREEITDFVLQIVQNKLIFSPCGLIDLNNARIAAMIGSITTLLVIVVQIGDTSMGNQNSTSTTILPTNETITVILDIAKV